MSIARHHAEWLSLLDISGPFLSLKVLTSAFPQGLDAPDADVARELRLAYEEWLDSALGTRPDAALHRAWAEWGLRRVLGMPAEVVRDVRRVADDRQQIVVKVPEYGEELRPDFVIAEPGDGGKIRMLVQIVPANQELEKTLAKAAWQASPATRMMTLLRGAGVRLGLLTNGEQWMLVDRPADENVTTGFASWYARLWLDEPLTLRAFRTLLGAHRFFGVPDKDTIEALLSDSANDRQEITDQLGYQVRRAVELLVQAIDLADQNESRALLTDLPEEQLYEAALTVMMRLVFLLFAEEQNLLLLGDDIYDQHYAVSTLMETLREVADRVGEEVLERRYDAWARLLAIFRAVYGGFRHDRLTMPAYGGGLFHPDRFPFLEGRPAKTTWIETPADPLPISNRVVLHLLEALQVLRIKLRDGAPAEARRLSFRALDIEQIGHVYEGLLDHTAVRAAEPVLGLAGTRDQEPEIPLADLEREAQRGEAAFLTYLQEQTGRSASALKKAWAAQIDAFCGTLLRAACGNDEALYARVLPFAGLVRDDDYGRPIVIPAGSVYVTAGAERRSTGTHYTPRSLTEPIVQHTLEPLVYVGPAEGKAREEWTLHLAADLLKLTVCDMAMGSGAFLVQACRYLSERLLEAWAAAEDSRKDAKTQSTEEEQSARDLGGLAPLREPTSRQLITAEGFIATNPDEAIPADADERLVFARRLVADRCLYSVDKNPLAVEMAKLSLWLITLAKGQPFSFLDHALRCGDSLLGISDIGQLAHWSLDKSDGVEPRQTTFITRQVEEALEVALRERRKIAGTRVREARDADLKAGWLATADAALALVKLGADLLVASALHPNPKQREGLRNEWLGRYSLLLSAAEETRAGRLTVGGQADAANRTAYAALRREADELLSGRRPFHWPLEFPEVFVAINDNEDSNTLQQWGIEPSRPNVVITNHRILEERTPYTAHLTGDGFAAIVGNPPFQGGKLITGSLGTSYRDYLVESLARGQRGHADLCAYFFLRGGNLTQQNGQLGLIATNTIAQGDTREVGLDQLAADGFVFPRAVPSRPWPGNAAVEVAHVWLRRGDWHGTVWLDEKLVSIISSSLTESSTVGGQPHRLVTNQSKSFNGSYVLGMGFVLEPNEAQALIARNPHCRDALFPYLNGEDLNSRSDQSPSRWVINFHDWPLERAENYPELMRIVHEKVKPERTRTNDKGEFVLRRPLPQRWWLYADRRPALYTTIAKMERVIVVAATSRTLAFAFSATGKVFSHATYVFALDKGSQFAIMQSAFHEYWAREYASSMKGDLRYTPSDVFETFPFPSKEERKYETRNPLDMIGERYHEHRRQLMLARQEGLTKTYNRFHDPAETSADIAELRRLHIAMDQAVAAAYGWADLDLGHGFHTTKQGLRYTISEAARRTVLDRLLALNHERYEQEVKAGLHDKGAKKAAGKGKRGKPAAEGVEQGELF
jgi:hypothetical protein